MRFLVFLLVVVHGAAGAVEFECSRAADQRFIRVDYPGQAHLCEVSVTRANRERRVLWYADNDSTFCNQKMHELVNKYMDQWQFDCRSWPDRDGIEKLSPRHRRILDDLVREVTREGSISNPGFSLTGARAIATAPSDIQAARLVAQLFLERKDGRSADRTYVIEDDGISHRIHAVVNDMISNISAVQAGYELQSAIISTMHPSGELEVNTTLRTSNTGKQTSTPGCIGNQNFRVTSNGQLDPINPHRYVCVY